MEKIIANAEDFKFRSTLLVPLPEFTKGRRLRWIDTFKSSDGRHTIDVIVFNTQDVSAVKSLLEEELAELKRSKHDAVGENSIKYIEKTLQYMEDPVMQHDVPAAVLEMLEKASGAKKAPQEVLFLSGISAIY